MTDDVSLRSTAPLFNFWAVFVPSNEVSSWEITRLYC